MLALVSSQDFHIGPGIIPRLPYNWPWYNHRTSILALVSSQDFHISPGIITELPYWPWYHPRTSISALVSSWDFWYISLFIVASFITYLYTSLYSLWHLHFDNQGCSEVCLSGTHWKHITFISTCIQWLIFHNNKCSNTITKVFVRLNIRKLANQFKQSLQ